MKARSGPLAGLRIIEMDGIGPIPLAAPFYRCYECADGGHVAVGSLEPQFFAQLAAGLGLEAGAYNQADKAGWPAMQAGFSAIFKTRTRDEWAARFAATDACVTPVLSMDEAPAHPHNQARAAFIERNGVVQPAVAPRFSHTPTSAEEPGTCDAASLEQRWR